MAKQWIYGNFLNTKTNQEIHKKLLKSSLYKEHDFISQGYKPNQGGNGVLYQWKNQPLAYWDIPTLNGMVFSKKLWETVHENKFIKAALETHCLWGDSQHRDEEEVFLTNVAIRVDDFHCDENNLVLGDVSLMDTPAGITIYALAKTGAIGESSRGFGELVDRGDGLQDVDIDSYQHVSFDCVSFPAVPACLSYSTSGDDLATQAYLASKSIGALEDELKSSINQAYERYPENDMIAKLYGLMNNKEVEVKDKFPLASSLKFNQRKNLFPNVDEVFRK